MSTFKQLIQWPPSVTTVSGVSVIVGTLASALTGQMPWATAVPILAGAAVAIILPDNGSAESAAKKLAADAMVAKDIGAAPVLVTDAENLAKAITDAAPQVKS